MRSAHGGGGGTDAATLAGVNPRDPLPGKGWSQARPIPGAPQGCMPSCRGLDGIASRSPRRPARRGGCTNGQQEAPLDPRAAALLRFPACRDFDRFAIRPEWGGLRDADSLRVLLSDHGPCVAWRAAQDRCVLSSCNTCCRASCTPCVAGWLCFLNMTALRGAVPFLGVPPHAFLRKFRLL